MAAKQKSKISPSIAVFLIVAAVFLLLAIFLAIQRSYSHKLKSISLTVSSGPVSPEYQQTQTVTLTKDSCKVSTTKTVTQQTTSQDCQALGAKFEDIQKAASDYGLIDKIVANGTTKPQTIGGKEVSTTIQLQDGTQFTTQGSSEFIDELKPFLDQIGIYTPEIRQLNI